MRYIPYAVVNVFSEKPFGGNAIAVVPDVQDLHETEMQKIAREFNLALTVFIDRPKGDGCLARLRFFTPERERMFSGKGTIAAWKPFFDGNYCDLPVAEADGLIRVTDNNIEFKASCWERAINVTVQKEADEIASVSVEMPMADACESFGDLAKVAEAIGVQIEKIRETNLIPGVVRVGSGKLFVALPTDADLESLIPSNRLIQRYFSALNIDGLYVFSTESIHGDKPIRGRGFYPFTGIGEDSASGSAIAGLMRYLVEKSILDGSSNCMLRVLQGSTRTSLIHALMNCSSEKLNVTITGATTLSRRGSMVLG